ncbi:smoothened-like [Tropilaelaps mercedesae]|uniref:Smoothened-like n=1 Tax=Tropilaelaps mercedesae TaxID=418985 RepID=A0A1V9XEW6_9ACAR|nr:smoothened-like [Tropilaelaps mercedesae]
MLFLTIIFATVVSAASPLEHGHHEATLLNRASCGREAKCEEHDNLTCFGSPLPYTSTTIELVDDAGNQRDVEERLSHWEVNLRQLPRCWPVIQPLLCSLYRPPCKNNSVHLISAKLCEAARRACSIIMPTDSVEWPHFLRCEQDIFSRACKSEMRKSETPKIRFNLTGYCPSPLVATSDRESWFSEIDGCGISCRENPLISVEEQAEKSWYDAWFVFFSASCCILTVVMHVADWRSSLKYPSRMRIYFAVCILIVCAGYAAQFIVGRDPILCKKDGTIRRGEPSAKENLVCVANFVACYYFQNAAYAWFTLICYAMYVSIFLLPSQGLSAGDYWKSKSTYFHLIAWSVPLVFTIFVIALSEIEADSTTGVCSVGQHSVLSRILLVVLPCAGAFLSGSWFLVRLMYLLDRRKNSTKAILNEESRAHIVKAIIRLRIFLIVSLAMAMTTGFCLLYEFRHLDLWRASIREHFSCRVNPSQPSGEELNHDMDTTSCDLKNKPSIIMLHTHLIVLALACLILLIVTLHSSVAAAWKQAFSKYILRSKTETAAIPFTDVIATLFEQVKKETDGEEIADSVSHNLNASYANMYSGLGYGVMPQVMVNRRYSSTSDVSRQTTKWMQSIARKRKTRKERDRPRLTEKTTSTGDIGYATMPLLPNQLKQQEQSSVPQRLPIQKSMVNKKDLINPPFTHGMSAEGRQHRLCPFRPKPRPSSKPPQPPTVAFPPIPAPGQQPMYAPLSRTVPAQGALTMHMPFAFPPHGFPLMDPYTGYPIGSFSPYFTPFPPPYPTVPTTNTDFIPFPDVDNINSPLIPLRAHETGSETSFHMVVPSDTEYDTDLYRPQTAVLRDPRQPKAGRLSAPPKGRNGFLSS